MRVAREILDRIYDHVAPRVRHVSGKADFRFGRLQHCVTKRVPQSPVGMNVQCVDSYSYGDISSATLSFPAVYRPVAVTGDHAMCDVLAPAHAALIMAMYASP